MRIGFGFFFARMRRMVGADNIDNALLQRFPKRGAVACLANGRVHLRECADLLISLGRGQS